MFSTDVWFALLVTLLAGGATLIGSGMLLFAHVQSTRLLSWGLGFAAGAMIYVSFTEIFKKSYTAFMVQDGPREALMWTTLFFFCGVALVLLLDVFIPNPHATYEEKSMDLHHPPKATHVECDHVQGGTSLRRIGLLTAAAITAHNFPEGAASFFAMLDSPGLGLPLALAIAIHNIPEGISIALPVYYATGSKKAAFGATVVSALAEPVGALLAYSILAPFLTEAVYGAVFGVIAGAMVFLSLDELLPVARAYAKTSHDTVYSLIAGMIVIAVSLILLMPA